MIRRHDRQPVFFAPTSVVAFMVVLITVHLLRKLLLGDFDQFIIVMLGIVPARYASGVISAYPGGVLSAVPTFVTYAFLHADLAHLAINSAWLLAFGSPVARSIGTARFIGLYLLCAVFAAGVHIFMDRGSLIPMIGASGAIAGFMAAAFRISLPTLFEGARAAPFFRGFAGGSNQGSSGIPLLPLTDRRFVILTAVWMLTNIAFGITGIRVNEQVLMIAWDAHIAGFVAGALLIPFFIKNGPNKAITHL